MAQYVNARKGRHVEERLRAARRVKAGMAAQAAASLGAVGQGRRGEAEFA